MEKSDKGGGVREDRGYGVMVTRRKMVLFGMDGWMNGWHERACESEEKDPNGGRKS